MLRISLRLVGLKIYFYDVFFLTKKQVQKKGIGKCREIFTLRLYEIVPDQSLIYY